MRVCDLTLVIDALLARNAVSGDPLAGSIDPTRIGISGISAGAAAAIGAAGGIEASGVPADPRIKAMVVYEPGLEYSLDDASRIAIPYLIMGGSQSQFGLAVPALFAETVLGLPRIYVLNPSATHFSYVTGMGAEIDQTREAALLADPALPFTRRESPGRVTDSPPFLMRYLTAGYARSHHLQAAVFKID